MTYSTDDDSLVIRGCNCITVTNNNYELFMLRTHAWRPGMPTPAHAVILAWVHKNLASYRQWQ